MNTAVLNLDWGSCFLKACAHVRAGRGRTGAIAPWLVSGRVDKARVEAWETLRLPQGDSLKAAFLSGRLSPEGLDAYRQKAEGLLSERVVAPLAARLREAGVDLGSLHVNIHTPLRLSQAEVVVGCGVFEEVHGSDRLFRPAYRGAAEWHAALAHPAQPRENRWGGWLMDRLQAALAREGGLPEPAFSLLPESITCVQDLAEDIQENGQRQFLVLDVGHFTTDYALVAFLNWKGDRMVVRRADSIFDAGSEFIQRKGETAWLAKVMASVTRFRADLKDVGILTYAPLGVVLVGGGVQQLSRGTRESLLVQEVHAWACQSETYAEGVVAQRRNTHFAPAPHIRLDLTFLGAAAAQRFDSQKLDLTLHKPSILACRFADMRCPVRVKGEASILALRGRWNQARAPFVEPEPAAWLPKGGDIPQPGKPAPVLPARAGAQAPSRSRRHPAVVTALVRVASGNKAGEDAGLKHLAALASQGVSEAAVEMALLHKDRKLKFFRNDLGVAREWLQYAVGKGDPRAVELLRDPAFAGRGAR